MAGNGFSKTVQQELKSRGMGIRTLSRKLDPEHPERARRNLNRWIHGGVKPSPANRIAVAVALGMREDAFAADDDDEEDAELHAALSDLVRIVIARAREEENA